MTRDVERRGEGLHQKVVASVGVHKRRFNDANLGPGKSVPGMGRTHVGRRSFGQCCSRHVSNTAALKAAAASACMPGRTCW